MWRYITIIIDYSRSDSAADGQPAVKQINSLA
jgi:hypothetical protein